MKIFVGIPREDPNLVGLLYHKYQPKMVHGGTIFQLGDVGWLIEKCYFEIPKVLLKESELTPFIMCHDGKEKGFCWFNFGLNGERLYPFHFSEKKNIITYLVPDGISRFVFHYDESFSLFQFVIKRRGNSFYLKGKMKWFGFVNEPIPDQFWRLEPMINLAFKIYRTKNLLPPDDDIALASLGKDDKRWEMMK